MLTPGNVDGQAFIQINGPFGGQEILTNNTFKPATVLAVDLDTATTIRLLPVNDTTEFPPTGTIQIGTELGVAYSSKTATSLNGITRTTPVTHLTGESVFGPGRNKSYFVAFDIDYLAVPGRIAGVQTVLGLDTPTSNYFTVGSPDVVDPIPSFNAEIGEPSCEAWRSRKTVVTTGNDDGPLSSSSRP